MTDSSETPSPSKRVIDCHVHLAALPEGHNGWYIAPKLLRSPLFKQAVKA